MEMLSNESLCQTAGCFSHQWFQEVFHGLHFFFILDHICIVAFLSFASFLCSAALNEVKCSGRCGSVFRCSLLWTVQAHTVLSPGDIIGAPFFFCQKQMVALHVQQNTRNSTVNFPVPAEVAGWLFKSPFNDANDFHVYTGFIFFVVS